MTRVVKCICCWDVLDEAWPVQIPYVALCDGCVDHLTSDCRVEPEVAVDG